MSPAALPASLFALFIPGAVPASGNVRRVIRQFTGLTTKLIPIREGDDWSDACRTHATLKARQIRWTPLAGLVAVRVLVVRPRPLRRRPLPLERPGTRPDLENYLKRALDALNGVVYRDDGGIVWLLAEKVWGAKEGLVVLVCPWDDAEARHVMLDMDVDLAVWWGADLTPAMSGGHR